MAKDGRPRVLMAGTEEAIALARVVLASEVAVVAALSIEAAVQRLDASIDLILCNVRFDDSRMFDFLAALQEGAYREVPVVCFRNAPGSLQPAMDKSLEMALAELGVAAFVDLPAIAQGCDMDTAMAVLRRRVLEALATGKGTGPRSAPNGNGDGAGNTR